MNEKEKKAFKVINTRTRRLLDELEIEKEDMSDEPKIAYLMQEIRANKTILNLIEKLQKENEESKNQEATARKINELLVQRYSNSIPVQIVKDKIRKNEEIIDISNDGDLIHELLQKNKVYEELLESEEIEMEEKYINKILNFADENINTAKELVINKEQANGIIKELQEDYTPNAIIRLKIAEYKERKAKCNDIETEVRLDVKIRAYEELLEKRK